MKLRHNVISLNEFIKLLVSAGAGLYRAGGNVEFVKLPRSVDLEKYGSTQEIEAGAFISTDGSCAVYKSDLMTFVGRKQIPFHE